MELREAWQEHRDEDGNVTHVEYICEHVRGPKQRGGWTCNVGRMLKDGSPEHLALRQQARAFFAINPQLCTLTPELTAQYDAFKKALVQHIDDKATFSVGALGPDR